MSEQPVDEICKETGVSREEALFYLEGYKWNVDAAMEACCTKTLPTVSNTARLNSANKIFPEATPMVIDTPEKKISSPISQKKLGQTPNEIMHLFCSVALGACLDDADAYLRRFDWNLDSAINAFFDERRSVKPYPPRKPPEINPSYAMAMELIHGGRMPPLPSLMAPLPPIGPAMSSPSPTLPPQCQALQGFPNLDAFQEVKIRSSSSSNMDIDLNTTNDSLRLVQDIPPIPDPAAKENLKGKAIDCGPLRRAEAVRMNLAPLFEQVDTPPPPLPPTIPITIVLADAIMASVQIPFRPDQTVGDIRKAIEDLPVQQFKDYTLLSATGVEFKDLTVTVARIVADDSKVLHQIIN